MRFRAGAQGETAARKPGVDGVNAGADDAKPVRFGDTTQLVRSVLIAICRLFGSGLSAISTGVSSCFVLSQHRVFEESTSAPAGRSKRNLSRC